MGGEFWKGAQRGWALGWLFMGLPCAIAMAFIGYVRGDWLDYITAGMVGMGWVLALVGRRRNYW